MSASTKRRVIWSTAFPSAWINARGFKLLICNNPTSLILIKFLIKIEKHNQVLFYFQWKKLNDLIICFIMLYFHYSFIVIRSPESLRCPIAMGWYQWSCVVLGPFTSSSREILDQSCPNLVCSICRVRRRKFINNILPNPKGR